MPKLEKYLPVSMSEKEVEKLLDSPNISISNRKKRQSDDRNVVCNWNENF